MCDVHASCTCDGMWYVYVSRVMYGNHHVVVYVPCVICVICVMCMHHVYGMCMYHSVGCVDGSCVAEGMTYTSSNTNVGVTSPESVLMVTCE